MQTKNINPQVYFGQNLITESSFVTQLRIGGLILGRRGCVIYSEFHGMPFRVFAVTLHTGGFHRH